MAGLFIWDPADRRTCPSGTSLESAVPAVVALESTLAVPR